MAGDIVVVRWLAVDQIGAGDWPRLKALLDDGERARAQRFHFDHDRNSYIAAHAVGRGMLSAWAASRGAGGPLAPSAWRFATGPHGKPEVISGPTGSRLRLNISHTRGLAAAVLTETHDVGVDVEWLGRRPSGGDIARRYFAPFECAQLEGLPPALAHETFLSFWTLKEAYIKAIGKGLAQPLDSFAFTLDPLAIRFETGLDDDPAAWLFQRLRPTPSTLMALAVRHPSPEHLTVDARAIDVDQLCQIDSTGPGSISLK